MGADLVYAGQVARYRTDGAEHPSLLHPAGVLPVGQLQAPDNMRHIVIISVPDPDPPDPHGFGPPESGPFYHQAKIVIKTLIPTVL
jgi:hypothetical protein